MNTSEVFSICNALAMSMWLLMIVLPKWKVTRFLIAHKLVPLALSLIYVFYITGHLFDGGHLDFGSLSSVMSLFTLEKLVMAGWVHYLAFDLLMGMWMLEQNRQWNIHPLLMALCLITTFILGPVGFLLFTGFKTLK